MTRPTSHAYDRHVSATHMARACMMDAGMHLDEAAAGMESAVVGWLLDCNDHFGIPIALETRATPVETKVENGLAPKPCDFLSMVQLQVRDSGVVPRFVALSPERGMAARAAEAHGQPPWATDARPVLQENPFVFLASSGLEGATLLLQYRAYRVDCDGMPLMDAAYRQCYLYWTRYCMARMTGVDPAKERWLLGQAAAMHRLGHANALNLEISKDQMRQMTAVFRDPLWRANNPWRAATETANYIYQSGIPFYNPDVGGAVHGWPL